MWSSLPEIIPACSFWGWSHLAPAGGGLCWGGYNTVWSESHRKTPHHCCFSVVSIRSSASAKVVEWGGVFLKAMSHTWTTPHPFDLSSQPAFSEGPLSLPPENGGYREAAITACHLYDFWEAVVWASHGCLCSTDWAFSPSPKSHFLLRTPGKVLDSSAPFSPLHIL